MFGPSCSRPSQEADWLPDLSLLKPHSQLKPKLNTGLAGVCQPEWPKPTRKLSACCLPLPLSEFSIIFSSSFLFFSFSERVSCIPSWPSIIHVVEDDLAGLILLPPLLECWDYRKIPLRLLYAVLGIELRTSCMAGKHSPS